MDYYDALHLTAQDVRKAYFSMRTLRLSPQSPLWSSVWAQQHLLAISEIRTPAMLEYAIFDLLTQLLIDEIKVLRHNYELPPLARDATLNEVTADLKKVVTTGNTRLMSLSAIYLYTVRADLELTLDKIDRVMKASSGVMRRYHRQTWRLLRERLLAGENEALRIQRLLQRKLSLPAMPLIELDSYQTATESHLGLIQKQGVAALHVIGEDGGGKTSVLLHLAHQLYQRRIVCDIIWLEAGHLEDISVDELVGAIAREVPPFYPAVPPLQRLHHHIEQLARRDERLCIVIDNIDRHHRAVNILATQVSHAIVLTSGTSAVDRWIGSAYFLSKPSRQDMKRLLAIFERRHPSVPRLDELQIEELIEEAAHNPARLLSCYQSWAIEKHLD